MKRLLGIWLLSAWLLAGCSSDANVIPNNDEGTSSKPAEINLQLGVEYIRRQKYDIAMNRLRKALELDEEYADAHNAIAVLYQRLKQNPLARRHYERALELKPQDSDIHNNYGQFLCKEGNWQEGETHFIQATKNPLYNTPEIPQLNAALCLKNVGQYAKAENYLRTLLSKNSKFLLALYHMADLKFAQKQYAVARDYLKRYSQYAPHNPQSLWLAIQIEHALGNKGAAASYAILLRDKYPDAEEVMRLSELGI